jgi:outer membrane receptor protein involved in Fe transport
METVELYYSEQGTLVPVRGVVGNNKIILLINGMRLNPPGGEELMIHHDISVRFAEQIEIVYGPGSTLYGQDAISAVINIKTKRPGDTRAEILGAYGNFNSREGFASFAARLREDSDAPISITGFVAARDSDLSNFREEFPDWWKSYEAVLPMVGRAGAEPVRNDFGLNAFARIESRRASLQAWYRQSGRSSTEGSGEGGRNPVLFFVPEANWEDRSLVVEGQYGLELSNRLTLHSILTFNRYEAMPESRYVFPNGMGGLFLADFKYALGTSTSLEEKLDYEIGSNTRLMVGVVGTNYDIIPKATVPGGADTDRDIVSQAGKLTYYTVAGDPNSKVEIDRAVDLHYQGVGAYAEGAHRFSAYLRAIAGVRVDVNTRYSQIPVSPRAALIGNLLDQRLTLKYVFSTAYVSPPPYYNYNIFDNGVQISSGNTSLKPERALSNEVNATWQQGGLLASASVYFNHQSNLLITSQSEAPETVIAPMVFVGDNGLGGTRRLTHSINLGTSNALGFDLSLRYSVSRVSLWSSYSFVDFKRTLGDVETGLLQISEHNVRAGFTWAILSSLSVTPSLVFRSTPENLTTIYQDAGVSLKNPYEVNLNVLYAPFNFVDAFLTIRNLTDHHYALRGVSGPALQEPFTAMLGARFKY